MCPSMGKKREASTAALREEPIPRGTLGVTAEEEKDQIKNRQKGWSRLNLQHTSELQVVYMISMFGV